MKIQGWLADYAGCAHYRLQSPLAALAETSNIATAATGILTDDDIEAADLIVGQRVYKPGPTAYWQNRIPPEKRVFEIDDDLWNVHPTSPAFRVFRDPVVQARLAGNAHAAKAVTVSTEPLADVMRKVNPNVFVLPNYIDAALLEHQRPRCEKVVIGWAGSATHAVDFQDARAPLARFFAKYPQVDLHLIGEQGFARSIMDALRKGGTIMPWQPSVDDYHRTIDFDIGLAPLASNGFNNCKSAIKALEYAALGIPVVASDFGPYRDFVQHDVTGFLCRTDHDWYRALRMLTEDQDLRESMGVAAKMQAADWTVQGNAHRWQSVYEQLVERVPVGAHPGA